VVGLLAPWLARDALKVPETLQTETIQALYLLALAVPVVISTAGLRGVLEAQQQFALASAVRLALGLFTYLGPLLGLPFSQSLPTVVVVLLVGRILACLVHLALCFHVLPALGQGIRLQRAVVGPLLHFGGWLTVTNVVGPLMVYLDRFLVGAVLSLAPGAYYVAPYQLVTRLLLLPAALVGVLFPAFATSLAHDR